MSSVESYIERARQLMDDAKLLSDPVEQRELLALALKYLRLAELAEKSEQTDVVYETPVRAEPQPQAQQQQQIQPDKKDDDDKK